MDKEMSLKNRDRLIQLGITISTFRKYRGLSQEQLAERASVSRSYQFNRGCGYSQILFA